MFLAPSTYEFSTQKLEFGTKKEENGSMTPNGAIANFWHIW